MSSAHNVLQVLQQANYEVIDSGASTALGNLVTRNFTHIPLVSAAAETRTLAAPTKAGQFLLLSMKTDGGDITLTVATAYDETGSTVLTFSDPGQFVVLVSVASGSAYVWRVMAYDGVTGPTTALGAITATSIVDTGALSATTGTFTGRMTTTDGVASGTAKVIGGLAYSNVADSTAIASTSAETVFDANYTLPANTLKAGTMVRIRYQGVGTTVVGTDTLAHKLYIGGSGGTALLTSAATTMVNGHTFQGEATLICRTAGTTGTFVATGTYKVNSAEGTMTVKDDVTASSTVNTQASQLITVTGQFNTTNANSVLLRIMAVEVY